MGQKFKEIQSNLGNLLRLEGMTPGAARVVSLAQAGLKEFPQLMESPSLRLEKRDSLLNRALEATYQQFNGLSESQRKDIWKNILENHLDESIYTNPYYKGLFKRIKETGDFKPSWLVK